MIFVLSWVSWYKFFWSAAPEPGRLTSRPLEREAHLTFFHPIFLQQKISINGHYLVSMNGKTSTDFSKKGRWSSQTCRKSAEKKFFHPNFLQQKISINGYYLVSMNGKTSTDLSNRGRSLSQTRSKSGKKNFFTQISSSTKLIEKSSLG